MSIYETKFAPSDKTDAILVVDGKKLHVNKALLSCHSAHFKTIFNSDPSKEEIEIKDVNFEDFATVLSFVHLKPIKPTAENAEKLLELAERFQFPAAKRHLELFLIPSILNNDKKIELAEKYQLDDLLNESLEEISIQTFRLSEMFQGFCDESKIKILNIFVDEVNS